MWLLVTVKMGGVKEEAWHSPDAAWHHIAHRGTTHALLGSLKSLLDFDKQLSVLARSAQYRSEELSGVARDKTERGLDLSLPHTEVSPPHVPHGVYPGRYQPVWGPVQLGSAVNPSSGQVAGNLGPLSAHRVTFSFKVTFQTTVTQSSMEPSPGPAIPKTQSSILCFGLICDIGRWQGPILGWQMGSFQAEHISILH